MAEETLSLWLNRRRREISEAEGWPGGDLISWSDLALRADLPLNNLLRWKDGTSRPGSFDYIYALARVFGPEIFGILGMDIDKNLAFLFAHREHPAVKEVIAQAKEVAETNLVTGKEVAIPAFKNAS